MEGVKDDGPVDGGAGSTREWGEGTVREVTPVPKINGGGIAVVGNKTAKVDADEGERVKISGRVDKGRANGEQAEVKGPEVLESRANMPKRVGADQRTVGEGGPIEGDNEAANGSDTSWL